MEKITLEELRKSFEADIAKKADELTELLWKENPLSDDDFQYYRKVAPCGFRIKNNSIFEEDILQESLRIFCQGIRSLMEKYALKFLDKDTALAAWNACLYREVPLHYSNIRSRRHLNRFYIIDEIVNKYKTETVPAVLEWFDKYAPGFIGDGMPKDSDSQS